MANITLGALRDYWKRVSDWVGGTSEDVPKVQLTGSFVKPKLAFSETTVGAGALISLPTISLGERTTSIALTVQEANNEDLNVEARYWFRWPPISGVVSIAYASREWATLQSSRRDTTPTIDVLGPILEVALRNRSAVPQTYIGVLIEREGLGCG